MEWQTFRERFYDLEVGPHIELVTDPALTESWCLRIGRVYLFWRHGPRLFIDKTRGR